MQVRDRPAWLADMTPGTMLQADKLEHMGLARVLPGRDFLDSSVEVAAARLSAALSAVVRSDAMRSSCQQMQSDMAAEDGAAVAASHIREALRSQPYVEVGCSSAPE